MTPRETPNRSRTKVTRAGYQRHGDSPGPGQATARMPAAGPLPPPRQGPSAVSRPRPIMRAPPGGGPPSRENSDRKTGCRTSLRARTRSAQALTDGHATLDRRKGSEPLGQRQFPGSPAEPRNRAAAQKKVDGGHGVVQGHAAARPRRRPKRKAWPMASTANDHDAARVRRPGKRDRSGGATAGGRPREGRGPERAEDAKEGNAGPQDGQRERKEKKRRPEGRLIEPHPSTLVDHVVEGVDEQSLVVDDPRVQRRKEASPGRYWTARRP